ncbi:hypothetical protein MMC29_002313, partial [Sticta canariensis]|nr:hypothetical protein [Sticta canariensis]
QESTEKFLAKKRRKETTKIEFLRLLAEIRNRTYSMVLLGSDVRPFKYTNSPRLLRGETFFQIYQELTYQLYQFSAFWFSDLESLKWFFTRTSAAHLALVRTVKLRLDLDDVLTAFRAKFSAEYLESNRQPGLEEIMSGWDLEHLFIEFPCGFQLQPLAPYGYCNLICCKWVVKAVMEYCSVHVVAKRVDFVGGSGCMPEERQALAEVKLTYSSISYASMDTSNFQSTS